MSEDERRRINPFDCCRAFSQVTNQGGFDAVIGNPPYGGYASELESAYLRARFSTVANSLDTFILFVENAASQLRPDGKVGMIIPSGWVSTPSSKPLREFFLANFNAESFVSLPFDVFKGAYIDCVIFTARKGAAELSPQSPVDLVVFPHRYRISGYTDFVAHTVTGSTVKWAESPDREFLITLSAAAESILHKMRVQPATVGEFVEVKRGIETYRLTNSTRGLTRPRRAFDGVLQRYSLHDSEARYLDYTPELEESKPWRFFSVRRILLRQVLSRKLRLQATISDERFLTNQSVQSLVPSSANAILLSGILAILNSRLMSWFFVTINSAARRDDFPKIIIKQTRELPMPAAESLRSARLDPLVDKILALNEREIAESLPHRREQLGREIEATDRRIDQLVYELYGLSEEEIRIIESATDPKLRDRPASFGPAGTEASG